MNTSITDPKDQNSDEEYRFICVDKSYFRSLFKKYYVASFLPFVPKKLTANFLTLLSSVAMWLLLALSFQTGVLGSGLLALAFAFLLHFYVLGDYLDGMHARDTGTSSPLGEFMDHHFDVYNSAITITACFALLHMEMSTLFYFILWLSYLAFGATMVEEKERGELYFGFPGPFEGVFAVFILFLSCIPAAGYEFWQAPLFGEVPRYWIVILGSGIGFAVTCWNAFQRVGYVPAQFKWFCFGSLPLVFVLPMVDLSPVLTWLILAFYCGDYIARVMGSHLFKTPHPYPDWIATIIIWPICLGAWTFMSQEALTQWTFGFGIYIGIKALWSIGRVFRSLAKYWIWVNP